jgi:hypothetical protein
LFSKRPERRSYKQSDFAKAMETLFSQNLIEMKIYGRKGDERTRIIRREQGSVRPASSVDQNQAEDGGGGSAEDVADVGGGGWCAYSASLLRLGGAEDGGASSSAPRHTGAVEENNHAAAPRVSTDAGAPHVSTDASVDAMPPNGPTAATYNGRKFVYKPRSNAAWERRERQRADALDEE